MKIFLIQILLLILFIPSISDSQVQKNLSPIDLNSSAASIEKHLNVLASDIFEGRGTGTTGGDLAAKYIALEYSKYGLKPVGNETSYYQNIPMHGSFPLSSSKLKIYLDSEETTLNLEKDYLLYKSGQQTFTPIPLQLIFVGYGIIAPEFDYNDYQSVDVEGKIVVFLQGEPESDNPEFFDGDVPTVYSYASSKQRIALSRGAAGSILIPESSTLNWAKQVSDFAFEDVNLAYSASNNLSILINPEAAKILFKDSDYSFEEILEIKKEKRLLSFPLKTELTFKGEYTQRDFLSQNIVGMVEGSDPELKDNYIIISAHYDHLGIGPAVNGDSVYNGALDNAIGVSVLLELAKSFSALNIPTRRSIIFIALTGEEKGLLGSTYYTDNPLVPLYKTVADINIDGVAMFRDFESVVGIGSEFSTLDTFLIQTASKLDLSVEDVPPEFNQFEAFNQSDQVSFALAGIPSILVLEGLKNKNRSREEVLNAFVDYILNRYHSPADDLNQEIDFTAAAQHAEVL
ncbi:MAG: M28 family peptidase, partial [Ignavibacteriaceae bacterium]